MEKRAIQLQGGQLLMTVSEKKRYDKKKRRRIGKKKKKKKNRSRWILTLREARGVPV